MKVSHAEIKLFSCNRIRGSEMCRSVKNNKIVIEAFAAEYSWCIVTKIGPLSAYVLSVIQEDTNEDFIKPICNTI